MATPNGTVLCFFFKSKLNNTSAISETGAPKQQTEKKKPVSKFCGMLKTSATINFMSPAPIIPVVANKKPTINIMIGIIILIWPDSIANPSEETRTTNTQQFLICLYKISVIQEYKRRINIINSKK